ncbi:MAG: HAD family phosphatase [Opitutales bacterium]
MNVCASSADTFKPFGAIFDWDGVVIDSSIQHERSWEMLAEEVGKPLPTDHFTQGFGKRNAVIIPEILGWTNDMEEIDRLGRRKEELYRELVKSDGIKALPGIRELLVELKAVGIPCVVGTSTERKNLELAFDLLDLADFFQGAVCSEDVIRGKPDPEVFLKAAALMDLSPERCVVLEDSAHGIEAARSGNMKALGLATTREAEKLEGAGAHCVIPDPTASNLGLLTSLFQG